MNKSQHQIAIAEHAGRTVQFMTKPSFSKWMKGNAKQMLDTRNRTIMESYIMKFGGNKE